MAEIGQDTADDARRFLTFRVDRHRYALPADEISEIIHAPLVARVPQSPKALLGLTNFRGSVLPVASLRALLGHEETSSDRFTRAIVLSGIAPIALIVDGVEALVSLHPGRIDSRPAELGAESGEMLRGAFRPGSDAEIAKILDIRGLLAAAFARRLQTTRRMPVARARESASARATNGSVRQTLLTFEVAGQEYALELGAVQEIIPLPETVVLVPRAEALVLGLTAFHDALLPLLSLRGLLGLGCGTGTDRRDKVIVVRVAGVLVGLVADRMRAIVDADPGMIDPTPSALAARTGGETKIKAIYRGDGGRRLISILAPEQLFREDVMRQLSDERRAADPQRDNTGHKDRDEIRLLVFRLGEEEFAVPIAAVDEVALVPEQIARVPKTPKFLEGVINLRGEVLPVVDQRRRFGLPRFDGERRRQRLVVVRSERHRAGLIVDSVSEVLRIPGTEVEPAPDLTDEIATLVDGVISLGTAGRIVLRLDPGELLSRAERRQLDVFDAATRPTTP